VSLSHLTLFSYIGSWIALEKKERGEEGRGGERRGEEGRGAERRGEEKEMRGEDRR
jgi:hypothetical protein